MSQPTYRVVYCSRNLLGDNASEQEAQIATILQVSRTNNSRAQVSGALLYNEGYFAQVLEGPREAVETTFERIQRDSRHSDVTVLEAGYTEERDFPDWSMAHVEPPTAEASAGIVHTLHVAMSDPEASGHEVLLLMRSLVVQED